MKQIYSMLIIFYALTLGQTACSNYCSYNGECKNDQCQCNENYLGTDCSVKAYPIIQGVPLTKNENGTYYAYHIYTEANPTTQQLQFSYNNKYSCIVDILITQLQQLTVEYYRLVEVSSSKSYQLDLSPEVQKIGNILITKIESEYNSDFTITYGSKQEDSISSTNSDTTDSITTDSLILAITLPIISVIVIVAIVLCYYKNTIKAWWKEKYPDSNIAREPIQNQVQLQQTQQEFNLNNPNAKCSLCRKGLFIGYPIALTLCQHQFHQNCILKELIKQQACPICSAKMASNQLIVITLPSQVQT